MIKFNVIESLKYIQSKKNDGIRVTFQNYEDLLDNILYSPIEPIMKNLRLVSKEFCNREGLYHRGVCRLKKYLITNINYLLLNLFDSKILNFSSYIIRFCC